MSSPKEFTAADAGIVPVEGPANTARVMRDRGSDSTPGASAGANAFNMNNEQLPDNLQEALRRLVYQFSTESESTRRQEVRRIKQAHQFWRGLQYLWWNERDQNWHLPFEQKLADGSSIEDLPRYEFVTNIYQAFGLVAGFRAFAGRAACAVLSFVGAGGRGCGSGESCDGSGGAGGAQQSCWQFDC